MASVNKVILVGNLGKDPEIRRTQGGMAIANLTLATSESWKDKSSGERKEKTEWHRVVIFNENLSKIAEQYLKKGSKVYLEGQLQTRKYTDKDGNEKYSTEVVLHGFGGQLVMLDSKSSDKEDHQQERPAPKRQVGGMSDHAMAGKRVDMDDEIPFAPEFR